ncbi:DoxX family protein [Actinoplanes couchii]|uniref:DoxX family protein n=1 Tax=Actinoplanes couchii TaxID=403638 RepID=A0ABQ3XJA9_9ACTN|nr:DoxX family protein [Actinoplanes couchii]MDR6324413.1 putative membrane protein YphA (DoxX/SURF4 family) [Actinoplanes couchii]GID58585.1 hypothetical protein Aco03nite_069890 [Actinoplanes couchii]
MRPVRTVARALLGSIFVLDGIRALTSPEKRAEAARPLADRIRPTLERADPRLPTDPVTLVRVKAVADVVAGLALATGRFTRPSAAVLAAGLVPHTLSDRGNRDEMLRDLGLLGGLLLAAADTEGRPGLRYRTSHAVQRSRRSARRTLRTARREARIAAVSAVTARKLPG